MILPAFRSKKNVSGSNQFFKYIKRNIPKQRLQKDLHDNLNLEPKITEL